MIPKCGQNSREVKVVQLFGRLEINLTHSTDLTLDVKCNLESYHVAGNQVT